LFLLCSSSGAKVETHRLLLREVGLAQLLEFLEAEVSAFGCVPASYARRDSRAMLWLVLAIFFFWSAAASAGDYKVTYAIDLEGRTDAGRIETCVYGHTCDITILSMGLTTDLHFIYPQYRDVCVYVSSRWGAAFSIMANRQFISIPQDRCTAYQSMSGCREANMTWFRTTRSVSSTSRSQTCDKCRIFPFISQKLG
jgi:hypothetical protein